MALLLIILMLRYSVYPLNSDWNRISVIVGGSKFDYVSWELDALATKAGQFLWGAQPFLDEAARSDFVRVYMGDLEQAQQLEAQIGALYLNNPEADILTADMRQQRDHLREDLAARQALVESILEGQVAMVLADEGFATKGVMLPPVSMHFTQMPRLLVVSPRDRIQRQVEFAIDPIPLEQIITLEEQILQELDLDALVVPLGGMALYPAMIQETSSIPWAVETFAHEWVHHYFFFYPLGLSFFVDTGPGGREALSINETAANIFGNAIAHKVLQRYYPEFLEAVSVDPQYEFVGAQSQATVFDFGAEMNQTRVTVDQMLALIQATGELAQFWESQDLRFVAEALRRAEDIQVAMMRAYMEARRQRFVSNGYRIRRLNLAYFAFYGGYQSLGVPGVAGTDPIGPAIEEIFALSADLREFVDVMRAITSRDELLRVRDTLREMNRFSRAPASLLAVPR